MAITHQPLSPSAGVYVSNLCLGTMNFGVPGRGHQGDWTLDYDQCKPIFEKAIEYGINYFDCANVYGLGATEEVVGKVLRELLPRSRYVLTTKVAFPMSSKPNAGGLSRKHILESVDASLERLGVDYVDQLIIHRHPHSVPGMNQVPVEETMLALHDVVKAGKAMYIGGSSMFAWQFAEMQHIARENGWTKFISMQNHYNLVYREEEREMNPYCLSHGIGMTPWSPLARGILTGSYKGSLEAGSTQRSSGADSKRTASLYPDVNFEIVQEVQKVASSRGVSMAQIALAWLLSKPEVVSPIIGVSKLSQLEDLVQATSLELSPDEIKAIEAPYRPTYNLLSFGAS